LKCPNCQKLFESGVKCPNCKVDTVLYTKTVRLSDKLHNMGLEQLKNGDIYHGIQSLSKSVAINKNNVPSRNLLGLALFEVGHVGDALKHWVISSSMLKEDNAATKYIENANKNARHLEKLNDAAYMYNQALGHIRQKSDDLAIIQLKKAIEINTKFVDALNLLALCYLIRNDKERALATVERVLSVDAFNPVALNYHAIISPGKKVSRPAAPKNNPAHSTPYRAMGLDGKKQRNFHFAELFTFLIGVAVTLAACYFLLIPALNRGFETERRAAVQELADARIEFQSERSEMESRIAELNTQIFGMETEGENRAAEVDRAQRINQINSAYLRFVDLGGDDNLTVLRSIVEALHGITYSDLPPDIIDRANVIFDEVFPRLGLAYYNAGLASFNPPRDSYMALNQLENARLFLSEDATQWNRMLFMLGTLYYNEDGRLEEAYDTLSALRERVPGLPHPFTGTERTAFNNMMTSIEGQR